MKRILDRFDNSPLWIRLLTVLALTFILVAGMYTVKKNTAAQVTTEIQPAKKTGSLPVKKVKDETQKQSLTARIQYIANYYGLTYEGDATATQQNQTGANANANANANGGAGVATVPAQQQQSTPAVDGGAQAPAETAQQ